MVFGSSRLLFSEWRVRITDAREITLDDVATEVGIAQGFRSTVAVLLGIGRVNAGAQNYARSLNNSTRFKVALLGGRELAKALHEPRSIVSILGRESPLLLIPAK